MLMKLLVNVFERARSKLTITRSNGRIPSDSDIEISNLDSKCIPSLGSSNISHQPRSSLSKWLCTIPASIDKSISSSRSNKIHRSSSWRSLKERGNNLINSRTVSVDELHRNNKKARRRNPSHSPIIGSASSQRKLSNGATSHTRFDRLSSNLVHYPDIKKKSPRRNNRKQVEQQLFSTLSHHSNGDSGYSEESFVTRSFRRPLHTSCPHCHCEQRSSFNNYNILRKNSSTESSPSDIILTKEHLLSSQSYPHIKPLPKINLPTGQKITRTLNEKRRRNLSCDGSLWARTQTQKPIILTSSPVFSEPNHLPFQRHFTTIGPTRCHPTVNKKPPTTNSNIFGELNLAAIELDSIETSISLSSYSSSSSSIQNEKSHRKQTFLVWHEYENSSLLSTTNGTKTFSVIRGDQVRLLKRIGKSTLLVQKEEDGSIGFLPQTCLAHHQINSFLSLKGLRETVL